MTHCCKIPNSIACCGTALQNDFDFVFLPLPPLDGASHKTLELYGRFMRHVRLSPCSDMTLKILSAIEFTADIMNLRDVDVAESLADMGLRAPRCAFPSSYLAHQVENRATLSDSALDMNRYWHDVEADMMSASHNSLS